MNHRRNPPAIMVAQAIVIIIAFAVIASALTLLTASRADAAQVEYCLVISTKIEPTAEGLRVIHLPPVKVPFDDCEIEKDRATAAMQAVEAAQAADLNYTGWVPASLARAVKDRWTVFFMPSVTVELNPETCQTPVWAPDIDWTAAWAGCF